MGLNPFEASYECHHDKASLLCQWHHDIYNNFDEETMAAMLGEEIETVFETEYSMNKVSVFRNIVILRCEDG